MLQVFDTETVSLIKNLAGKDEFDSTTIREIVIQDRDDLDQYEVLVDGDSIMYLFDITDLTVDVLDTIYTFYNLEEPIGHMVADTDWEYDKDEEIIKTPHNGHELTFSSSDDYKEWSVVYPEPTKYNDYMYRFRNDFDSYTAAVASASVYVKERDPVQLEYKHLLKQESLEIFTECGIHDKTAVEFIDHNIFSFEDILDNLDIVIDRDEREEVREIAQEYSNTDQEPEKSDDINEFLSKITVENL